MNVSGTDCGSAWRWPRWWRTATRCPRRAWPPITPPPAVHVYGRERLGEFWGYLAGWAFVVGKTASCAAMALPAAVGRTVYRIVQESLTNIARHADATSASVRIDYRPDAVALQVDDNGKATPDAAPVPGMGLLGMRERVTALGGRLRAAPRGEGGFTVQAELPVERAS